MSDDRITMTAEERRGFATALAAVAAAGATLARAEGGGMIGPHRACDVAFAGRFLVQVAGDIWAEATGRDAAEIAGQG